MEVEKIVINYGLKNGSLLDALKTNYFPKNLQRVVGELKEFYENYSTLPTKETIYESLRIVDSDYFYEKKGFLDELFDFPYDEINEVWMQETSFNWLHFKETEHKLKSAVELWKTSNVTPENVSQVASKIEDTIIGIGSSKKDNSLGMDFFDANNFNIENNAKFYPTGIDFLDETLGGGLFEKCLYSFLGQPKVGKSIWLQTIAACMVRGGYNTAVISLELSEQLYRNRMASVLYGINTVDLKRGLITPTKIEEIKNRYLFQKGIGSFGDLFIKEFPTSSATVKDFEAYLLNLEKKRGKKFHVVVVDYIGIVSDYKNPNSDNTYLKIKNIAESLRAMAKKRNNWVVVTASQINRTNIDAEDLTMKDVSESMGLVNTVDALIGIIKTPEMHSLCEYILKIIANRNDGFQNMKKRFNINWNNFNIVETTEPMFETN